MTTVKERMTPDPVICQGSFTLTDAAKRMREEDIGDVLVDLDDGYGIVTDRDIVTRAVADGLAPDQATLEQVATRDIESVEPSDDLDEVVNRMRERHIRRVPVLEDGRPVGILAIGDLAVIRDPDSALADISAAHGDR